jgi:hypothetical protein
MLKNSMLTTKLSAAEKISASIAAGETMQGEAVEDEEQPYNSNDNDDIFLNQMNADDEVLQIQADNQLAAEKMRASAAKRMGKRPAANDSNADNTDDSTGEAAKARNVPRNDSDSETEIGRQRGFGGMTAKEFESLRARVTKRREERTAANNGDDNNDTDDSRVGEAAEARVVPRNDSDSETEIGKPRGFMGISAEDVESQLEGEDEDNNAVQPLERPARKQPLKQPLKHPRAKAADTIRLTASERKVRTLLTSRQLAITKHEAAEAKWAAARAKWAKKPENKHKQYHVPKPTLVQPRRTRSGSKLILLHFYSFVSRLTPYCVTQMRYP